MLSPAWLICLTKQPSEFPGEIGLRDIRIVKAIYSLVAEGNRGMAVSLG